MRLPRGLKQYGLVALAVPGFLLLTGVSTLADSSPSPTSASGPRSNALPGDPTKGEALYGSAGCGACHGASLEGGVGATLNPIEKLSGVPNSLDPSFLIAIITNGREPQPGDPRQTKMPAKGGTASLSEQDIKDLAAYIIQANRSGEVPLSPGELAKRTIFFVGVGIVVMVFITYLLAQYNMRWIARRAAARRR
ncbi:MAG: cytochrome c [Chloroflexi bacterium]|nr:MAG: cytochrome c [Chloroflexota bacterium]